MCFEIHFGLKHYKFLGQTVLVQAQVMISLEMLFQRLVVQVILGMSSVVSPVADVALFVFLSAMNVELVVTIEAFLAKATLWVSLEAALINSAWVVVANLLVPS